MSTPEIPKDSVNTRYSLYDANDLYFNGGYAPEYMNSVYAYNNGIVTADNVAIFAFSGDSSGGYLSSTGMTDWQPGQEYNNTYTGMTEWNGNQNNYTGMKEWTGNQGNYTGMGQWSGSNGGNYTGMLPFSGNNKPGWSMEPGYTPPAASYTITGDNKYSASMDAQGNLTFKDDKGNVIDEEKFKEACPNIYKDMKKKSEEAKAKSGGSQNNNASAQGQSANAGWSMDPNYVPPANNGNGGNNGNNGSSVLEQNGYKATINADGTITYKDSNGKTVPAYEVPKTLVANANAEAAKRKQS